MRSPVRERGSRRAVRGEPGGCPVSGAGAGAPPGGAAGGAGRGGAGRAPVPGGGGHGGRGAALPLCGAERRAAHGGGQRGAMSYQGKKNIPRITVGLSASAPPVPSSLCAAGDASGGGDAGKGEPLAEGRGGGAQTKSRRPRRCPRQAESRAEHSPGGASAADGADDRSSGSARGSGPAAARELPLVLPSNRGPGAAVAFRAGMRTREVPAGRGHCGRPLPVGSAAGSLPPGSGSAHRAVSAEPLRRFPLSPAARGRSAGGVGERRAAGRGRSPGSAFASVVCEMLSVLIGSADSEPISFLAASGAAVPIASAAEQGTAPIRTQCVCATTQREERQLTCFL